ncbi:helix-turn-helix domain-containing protein [Bacillus sp. SL00103]
MAAKQLNIHINTLNYRLKRITDIAEIDLKNMNEEMTIYLDRKLNVHICEISQRGVIFLFQPKHFLNIQDTLDIQHEWISMGEMS